MFNIEEKFNIWQKLNWLQIATGAIRSLSIFFFLLWHMTRHSCDQTRSYLFFSYLNKIWDKRIFPDISSFCWKTISCASVSRSIWFKRKFVLFLLHFLYSQLIAQTSRRMTLSYYIRLKDKKKKKIEANIRLFIF